MTRKQVKKLAQEIARCERIHQSSSSSKEEKLEAEASIMRITNQIISEKNGLELLGQIDDMVIQMLKGDN